jgi:hypothetical protein
MYPIDPRSIVVFLPRAYFYIAALCALANKHMLPVLRDADNYLRFYFGHCNYV